MQNVYMGLDVEEFIFGEGTTYEESYSDVTDEEMNEFGIIECVDDPDVALCKIALENEQNHNAIMMAMLTNEYGVLESTGNVMVYESGAVKSFLNKVKEQIMKFWAKVKGVFKKVIDKINTIVSSNKSFVKKYRSLGNITDKENKRFTGYKFNADNLGGVPYSKAVDEINKTPVDSGKEEDMKKVLDNVRTALCFGTSCTAENFETNLKEKLYGSKNTQDLGTNEYSFQTLLDNLENAKSQRKAAKYAHGEAEKSVRKLLSSVKELMREAEHGSKDEKDAKSAANAISRSLNIMTTALRLQTTAILASAIQDRKVANQMVMSQHKKDNKNTKAVNASAIMDLDNLVLI